MARRCSAVQLVAISALLAVVTILLSCALSLIHIFHNKFPFEVEFLVMDPGYSPENRRVIEENARKLNIPIHIFESNIFESVYHVEKSPCYPVSYTHL